MKLLTPMQLEALALSASDTHSHIQGDLVAASFELVSRHCISVCERNGSVWFEATTHGRIVLRAHAALVASS